ncbi:MarR family winged helix-turn-helix transcriptional regulator [Aquincola tertiaricarbonis]|uniref:MarR family winged helix-turn-helix transcriptional regulator n=1 Tax=Aquincola tertiaricarbonis TaxID=391953 RepID=UPI000614DBC8|nr:MarR family transcriptional regulator [Aquincola tertiaricarbonis]
MRSAPTNPLRDLVIEVFQANGLLIDTGNGLVRDVGLTSALWQVLAALGYAPVPLPVAHIARAMGLTRQAVQRVVHVLAERGFVELQPNPQHRRAPLVVLTEQGSQALAAAEAAEAPMSRQLVERIGVRRVAAATAVLRELNALLQQGLVSAADADDPDSSTP